MKNGLITLAIICVILASSYIAYNEDVNFTNAITQQAEDKALQDSISTRTATVDSVYNSLTYDVLQELYFQIGDESPREYIVDEYLEHQDYYNNLD